MALMRTTLEDRIKAIQADVDQFIDSRVEADAKACPGVPAGVLRGLLTAKGGGCLCRTYAEIKKRDAA